MLPSKKTSTAVAQQPVLPQGKQRYVPHSLFLTLIVVGILACLQAGKVEKDFKTEILREFVDSLKGQGYEFKKVNTKVTPKVEEVLEHELTSCEYEQLYATWIHYLKYREGYKPIMYLCPAGFKTIGYGHNIDANGTVDKDTIQYSRASELLHQDLQKQYEEVRRELPLLNRAQHLAITSLAANCGLFKIKYTGGKKSRGLSTFWKECMKNGKPNFKVYCKYRTPKGQVCTSTNLVNARAFEEMLYYGRPTANFQFGKKKVRMSYAQVGDFFRRSVIKRDIKGS